MATSPLNLSNFPEVGVLEHVAGFLKAPDLLSFLSAHPTFRSLGCAPKFWHTMNEIQYPSLSSVSNSASTEEAEERDEAENLSTAQLCKKAKDAYLLKAHCHLVPKLQWYAVNEGRNTPSDREGHLACKLGNYIVMTGGFTQDSAIYVKDIRDGNDWQRILPDADSPRPEWVYGASLTALDETRAVRFGGFRAGGYSAETPQVCVLHLTKSSNGQDGGGGGADQLRARWEIVLCRVKDPERGEPIQDWPSHVARAYHATILLQQRYLMVVGGMQSEESILDPLVLDTLTWTWHVALMDTPESESPAPRHGCSLIHDSKGQKLLLFGGGSGSDLLRSGEDYPDVWEVDMTASTAAGPRRQDLLSTLPWKWNLKVRQTSDDLDDDDEDYVEEDDDENYVEEDDAGEENDEHVEDQGQDHPNVLSPAERLNLGRCHGCYHIADDTCLLAFGGRPSTNSILGYRLDTEEFFRPVVQGPVPEDRFTFASVHLMELGYLVVHGGYSCRSSDTMSSTCVLDLAPGMQRPFLFWPIDRNARSHPVVTDEFVQQHQTIHGQTELNNVIPMLLMRAAPQRPLLAAMILAGSGRLSWRTANFLHRVATRRLRITEDGRVEDGEAAEAGTESEEEDSDEESFEAEF